MIKKTLLIFAALIALMLGLSIFFISSGPGVPDGVDKIITEISQEELPEFMPGQTGITQNKLPRVTLPNRKLPWVKLSNVE